jgi:hypothetical protein
LMIVARIIAVVASKLMANLEGKKAAAPGPARKKLGRMSTNCERRRDLGAVQLAESTSSYSTSAVRCCAHSEQLNMSRLQPGVPVREMSYSRIARPQLGHAGVLATGCSDDLNKLNWGMAPLLALPTNSQQRLPWLVCHSFREQLAGAHVRQSRRLAARSATEPTRRAPVDRGVRCHQSSCLLSVFGMREIYQKSNLRAIGPRSNKSS